jgi:hypothetical protein
MRISETGPHGLSKHDPKRKTRNPVPTTVGTPLSNRGFVLYVTDTVYPFPSPLPSIYV